jgi:RelE-like toxin of type II toxin-antitoxin system HigB
VHHRLSTAGWKRHSGAPVRHACLRAPRGPRTAEVVADLARSPERLAASAIAKAAVWVDANWRLVFAFEGEDAVLVDYTDYH